MKLTVAVIIPCFNSGRYLKAALKSILTQTYTPLEVIAVDDGSRDETREILRQFEPNIRVESHGDNRNLGQYASLNLGIARTSARLLAFLDHDDTWSATKLEEQVRAFESNPSVGLVYTNGHAIDEKDNKLYRLLPEGFIETNDPGKLLVNCYIKSPSSVMVRRTALEAVGLFKEYLPACADHDLWLRISERFNLVYIEKSLIGYRIHQEQLSVVMKERMWKDSFLILRESLERHGYGWNVERRRLAVLHYRLGQCQGCRRAYVSGVLHYLTAGVLDPMRALRYLVGIEQSGTS